MNKNTGLRNLQLYEYELLLEVDRICKKYDIQYSLAGGTLLGSIRHSGFIPWDDDIDIYMTRQNYNKFIEVQETELNDDYYLDCIETNDECGKLYGQLKMKKLVKIKGISKKQVIFMDIFPIDNISDNKLIQKTLYTKIYCLKIILLYKYGYLDEYHNKLIWYLIKFLSVFYNKKKLKNRLQKIITKYNNKETNYVACFPGVYLGKEVFKKHIFSKYIKNKFETKKFSIIKNYDEYLTQFYGDYMTPPPKDKRKPSHR